MEDLIEVTKQDKLKKIYEVICPWTRHTRLQEWEEHKPIYHCMIWDVFDRLDWYEKDIINFWLSDNEMEILVLWNMWKNKPIDDQSDECIDFIYSLLD